MFKNLFHHLSKEHDVILLEQEKQEIIHEIEQQPLYFIRVTNLRQKNKLCEQIQSEWIKYENVLLASDLSQFIASMNLVVTKANQDYPKCKKEQPYCAFHDDVGFIGLDNNSDIAITLTKIKSII